MKTSYYRLIAALWTIGIVLAMTIPTGRLASVQPEVSVDKLAHIILFAGFGGLWLRGLCPPDGEELPSCFRRRGGLFFVAGVLFAVGTEMYQHFLPIRRMADPYDVTADLVGFVAAFVGYYLYYVRRANWASA